MQMYYPGHAIPTFRLKRYLRKKAPVTLNERALLPSLHLSEHSVRTISDPPRVGPSPRQSTRACLEEPHGLLFPSSRAGRDFSAKMLVSTGRLLLILSFALAAAAAAAIQDRQ